MRRRLTLVREPLHELTNDDLARVAGAADTTSCPSGPSDVCPSKPLLECLMQQYSLNYYCG